MMWCPNCNKEFYDDSKYCKFCSKPLVKKEHTRNIHYYISTFTQKIDVQVAIAMILTYLFPGLGHLFNRQYLKAILIIILNRVVCWLISFFSGFFGIYGTSYNILPYVLLLWRLIIIADVYVSYVDIKDNKESPGFL